MPPGHPRPMFALRLSPAAIRSAEAVAERRGTNRSEVIRHWLTLGRAADPELARWPLDTAAPESPRRERRPLPEET